MLDEANAYERGMDDDLTFQTVRELAGTAYMAGRSAPPTDAEVEAVAKRLCWNSCEWDGIESDYVAKDEDDAWDYAGEICGYCLFAGERRIHVLHPHYCYICSISTREQAQR